MSDMAEIKILTAPILNEQRLLGVIVGHHLVPSL
jgi:hypothetical protein